MISKTILLLVLFTITTSSDTIDQQILLKIKEIFSKNISPYPSDYDKYIKNINIDLDLIYTKDEQVIKRKCDEDIKCIQKLEEGEILEKVEWSKIVPSNNYLLNSIYYSLVSIRIDKKVMYLFVKAKHNGSEITKNETYRTKKCERRLFFTKCYFINKERPRPLNAKEKQIVNKALELTRILKIIEELNKYK